MTGWKTGSGQTNTSATVASNTLPTPVPPPATVTLWGAYVNPHKGESQSAADARFDFNIGATRQIARTYDNSGGIATMLTAANNNGLGHMPQMLSFEPTSLANLAAGTDDSGIMSVLNSLSTAVASAPDPRLWITMDHEFNNKIKNSTYPFSGTGGWAPGWLHFASLLASHGDPNLIPTVVLGQISTLTFDQQMTAYWPTIEGTVSCMALDYYPFTVGTTASALYGPLFNSINALSTPPTYAVAETSPGYLRHTSTPDALAYLESELFFDGQCQFVTQWNDPSFTTGGVTYDFEIDDLPTLAAYYKLLETHTA